MRREPDEEATKLFKSIHENKERFSVENVAKAFKEALSMEEYKHEPHQYITPRRTPFMTYCIKCGLVLSGNEFTRWANGKGCNNKDHPSYAAQRAKTSPFK
jgi:hypothetical protein